MTRYNEEYAEIEINREDMLSLTRRMTLKRTSIIRVAGAYIDSDGFIDGTFNTRFLRLSGPERVKNLEIAKVIPFADANRNLKRYRIPDKNRGKDSLWQLLMGARAAGLENDSLLDIFYDIMAEKYQTDQEYGVFLYYDRYDIPSKAADHERLGESERVFEYLICGVCRVSGDYEPEKPECGFLFPAYSQGGALVNYIDIFQSDEEHPHTEFTKMLLG